MTPRPPYTEPVTADLVIRSALFAAGQAIATLVIATLALIAAPLPYRMRYRLIMQWTRFNAWWLYKTCRLTHEVEGLEHIPRRAGIVLCKHQSAWETINLQHYFHPQVWVLKRELLWLPFFGWGLATLRPIAIDRTAGRDAVEQVLRQGADRLADGIWVVIFPEGTRVAPGEKRRYRMGGALLAERTGHPVVPVAHNSGDYWPRRSFIKRPGCIRLVIGPCIESEGKTAAQINTAAERWIEGTVARLRRPYTAQDALQTPDAEPRRQIARGARGGRM